MMRVSHAILHAFDFESGTSYPSDRELDLGSRPVKSYVQRHMRKIASSAESRHGTFAEDSSFGAGLAEYFAGRVGFVELSQQLAQFMWEQLRMCDDLVECDLLVCDFTDTKDMRLGRRSWPMVWWRQLCRTIRQRLVPRTSPSASLGWQSCRAGRPSCTTWATMRRALLPTTS